MNIALYGGKFDPPHLGHKLLIDEVLRRLKFIDEVWIIPAKSHPWRKIETSGTCRLQMLLFWESGRVKVLDIDLKRVGETRTIDTIKDLKRLYPENNYFWICGSDTVATFDKWKSFKKLIELMKFYVYPRPGYELTTLPSGFFWIPGMKFPRRDYSSTEIRQALKTKKKIGNFLTPEIYNYILENHLYLA